MLDKISEEGEKQFEGFQAFVDITAGFYIYIQSDSIYLVFEGL